MTSRMIIATVMIWLAAPTPETASSDTELSINVSTLPISINKKTSRKIGHVSRARFIDLPSEGISAFTALADIVVNNLQLTVLFKLGVS
ncbi:hypothetical protein D3C73_1333290 [compost metagenome]